MIIGNETGVPVTSGVQIAPEDKNTVSVTEPPKTRKDWDRFEYSAEQVISNLVSHLRTGGYPGPDTTLSGNGPYHVKEDLLNSCTNAKNLLIQKCGYTEAEANAAIRGSLEGVKVF